jgi:hypothetical protein
MAKRENKENLQNVVEPGGVGIGTDVMSEIGPDYFSLQLAKIHGCVNFGRAQAPWSATRRRR